MSWLLSTSTPTGPNFHPVQDRVDATTAFGELSDKDTEWLCPGGFITETQTFYATTAEGALVMAQVIHSSVGLWYPNIQFTFRYFNPTTKQSIWKSTTVSNFTTAPKDGLDKRSCKADQFSITLDPAHPDTYKIEGSYDEGVQISLTVKRLAKGFKVGAGPRGGFTYFGQLKEEVAGEVDTAAGDAGYCVHRFWPRCAVDGILRLDKDVVSIDGSRGVFIHAIQGLRPNVLAASWNFANFQSPDASLIMMEFTTTEAYGGGKANVGCVVVGDELVAVVAGPTKIEGLVSSAEHLSPALDPETGYKAPSEILYTWKGAAIDGGAPVGASLKVTSTAGLIEKVDVLGQIPYLIRKFVNYAAGTKPYIYTWLNPAQAAISVPQADGTVKDITVSGHIFNEATFISE